MESGRHEELLARPGSSYAKLYATQVFDSTPSEADAVRRGPEVGAAAAVSKER